MAVKAKHILLRSILGALLVLFLAPFSTRIDNIMGFGQTVTGLGSVIGASSHVRISSTITDPSTGEVHKLTFGDTEPEPFAVIALVAALLSLVLTFTEERTGRFSPGVGAVACAVSLMIWKFTADQDVLKNGFGIITVEWRWGFWLAFAVALAAAAVSFLPAKQASIPVDDSAPTGLHLSE
ncbi:MAG: hypothetical protein ABSF23_07040 [Terracidiphilus sp.]|jgi:hypothetical protein